MALVTIQRSPSPSTSAAESEDTADAVEDLVEPSDKSSPNRQRRSKTALKRLKKFFNTVRFISKLRPFSESYFAVKGAALILPQNENECTYATRKITRTDQGEIQHHLQSMFYLLRPQDTIKVAVKLEGNNPDSNRYMAVVSCIGRQDTEESIILGIDCDETATIGLVFPIWADTSIKLEGDGGFTVECSKKTYVFKPVSIQAMWSALQSLNKVVKIAQDNRYIPSGLTHTWVGYYESKITSTRPQIAEWNANEIIEFFRSQPIEDENDDEESAFKKKIKVELKNVMMRVDLDEASSKMLRTELEKELQTDLKEYRSFIDNEMLLILGQLDSPTLIKDHVYLGSEWNASNLEELTNNGVGHILNISKEIDNFFPGTFDYMNVREWDSEETDLIKYWEDTYKFIAKARSMNSKTLVHCKMGISRSASTVMAYLMKEYAMTRQEAYDYTKGLRSCIMPNSSFWRQLETYEGILVASRQREVFKSKSAINLAEIEHEENSADMENCGFGDLLGHDLSSHNFHHSQSLPGNFDDSVFLPPITGKDDTDICGMEFEMGSRSADSAEDSLSDHPSPKPEEEGKIFQLGGDENEDDEGSDISDGMEDVNWNKTHRGNKERKSESEDDSQSTQQKKLKPDHYWIKSNVGVIEDTDGKDDSQEKDVPMEVSAHETDSKEEGTVCEGAKSVITGTDDSEKVMDTETGAPIHYERENIPWVTGTVQRTKQDIEERYRESTPSTDIPDTITILVDGQPYVGLSEERQGKVEITHAIEGATVCESTDEPDKSSTEEMDKEDKDEVPHPKSVYQLEEISLPPGIVLRTKKEIEERSQSSVSSGDIPSSPLQRSASLKGESAMSRRRRPDRERRRTCTPILSPESNTTEQIPQSGAKTFYSDDEESASAQRRIEYDAKTESMKEETSEHDVKVYKLMGEEVAVEKGIVQKQRKDIEGKSRQSSETKDLPQSKPAKAKAESESCPLHVSQNSLSISEDKNVPKCDIGASDYGSQSEESAIEDMPLEFLDIVRDEQGLRATVAVSKIKSAFEKQPEPSIPTQSPIVSRKGIEENQNVHIGEYSSLSAEKDHAFVVSGSEERSEQTRKERKLSESDSEISVSVSERKENYESLSKSPESPEAQRRENTAKKWADRDRKSNIDQETLALIREIGSAILNSPAKSQMDEDRDEEKCGNFNLVRHFVKDIERRTQKARKPSREILIVDKEMQERQKRVLKLRYGTSGAASDRQTAEDGKQDSKSQRVPDIPISSLSESKDKSSEKKEERSIKPRFSPTEQRSHESSLTWSKQLEERSASTSVSDQDKSVDTMNIELDENPIDKVRNLVGKFEIADTKSPPVSSPISESASVKDKQFPVTAVQSTERMHSDPENQPLQGKHIHVGSDITQKMELDIGPGPSETKSTSNRSFSKKVPKSSLTEEEIRQISSLPNVYKDPNEDILPEESVHLLQLRRNLRKTSLCSGRPKSADLLKRHHTSPGYSVFTLRRSFGNEETQEDRSESSFSWGKNKIRKMQGKSHPLTKLENRRNNPFYNTM